jgi:hypothetical protein
VPVRHHDSEIRLQSAQTCGENIADWPHWLKNRDTSGLRRDFHWRGNQLRAGPSLRLVRLGNGTGYGEAAAQQRLQRRHGEGRRTEEDESHHSDRADAAWTSFV